MTRGLDNGFNLGYVRVKIETEKALLVIDHDDEEHWIPKSQIHDDSEVWKAGQDGDLFVSEWFAERKGRL